MNNKSRFKNLIVEPLSTEPVYKESTSRFKNHRDSLRKPANTTKPIQHEEFSQNFQGASIPLDKFLRLPGNVQAELQNTHEYDENTKTMIPR